MRSHQPVGLREALCAGIVCFGEFVYRHLQRLSPTYYARIKSGEILARLDGDVAEVQRFAVDSPLALINSLFGLLVALILMVSLSPALSLIALLLIPLQVVLLRRPRPLVGSVPWLCGKALRPSPLFDRNLAGDEIHSIQRYRTARSERLNGLNRRISKTFNHADRQFNRRRIPAPSMRCPPRWCSRWVAISPCKDA
ncbi:MAG: ABC transporter transmembrane domain-containing protein [Candidatus Competibacteraceae bacterium]